MNLSRCLLSSVNREKKLARAKAFGTVVRSRRKTLGFSQRELADEVGVMQKSIWEWENGYVAPNLDSIWALSEALSTTPSELMSTAEEALEDD